jgi:hypothetical protein
LMFVVYSITGAALNVNDNRNGFRISIENIISSRNSSTVNL